ncbi:ABC transporter substrate-binding protein [Siccirubricoccus deserti]|uniref:Extracellular solute-binding protein n=1 Tax=Siccirubricoccus deserti TaxID=2013562 RepID=A0A9X0UC81_9PROT|nr:extracellular solute-binding protein [Siccirubricoccus deserti]MBC4014098.1 extracellular solute-binding protein [Siccirubricoccus deserti]GGC26391.1 ABC transporter substrate-binding protein [Siccirubricoccus deserti]
MQHITRRATLALGAASLATGAQAQGVPRAEIPPPAQPIEQGAALRVIRPARFIDADETIFRENAARFSERYNVPVRVDFVGWEDIRPQTAVIANTGSGPDVVIGWADDPHVYVDKLHDLSELADYLGRRYGGWSFLARKYGMQHNSTKWIGIPFGGGTGPICYRASALREAGFDKLPEDHAGFLRLCQALKRINKPAGFALGNAVGDGNGFANWLLWSHGASLTDEEGTISINSRETLAALNYLRELYPTFAPGTLSWLDPSNNRAYASQEVHLTANGVSLYYALKNDPRTKPIADDTEHAPLPRGVSAGPPQSATVLNAMVFRHVRYPNAAKEFIRFMMEAEQYDPWLTGSLGYWSQPLEAYRQSAVWTSDPKLTLFREAMNHQYWSGYKGPITQASGAVAADYVLVQMCSSVASGQATPEAAAREAERRARRYYRA